MVSHILEIGIYEKLVNFLQYIVAILDHLGKLLIHDAFLIKILHSQMFEQNYNTLYRNW